MSTSPDGDRNRDWAPPRHWTATAAIGFVVLTASLLPVVTIHAQTRSEGADLYKVHCAACHGLDARGDGLMAPTLKHAPPDLTQLARKNGGMFPRARVRRVVEGLDVSSHGDRDMPVWGDVFKKRTDPASDTSGARINAIIDYLDSIQARPAH